MLARKLQKTRKYRKEPQSVAGVSLTIQRKLNKVWRQSKVTKQKPLRPIPVRTHFYEINTDSNDNHKGHHYCFPGKSESSTVSATSLCSEKSLFISLVTLLSAVLFLILVADVIYIGKVCSSGSSQSSSGRGRQISMVSNPGRRDQTPARMAVSEEIVVTERRIPRPVIPKEDYDSYPRQKSAPRSRIMQAELQESLSKPQVRRAALRQVESGDGTWNRAGPSTSAFAGSNGTATRPKPREQTFYWTCRFL